MLIGKINQNRRERLMVTVEEVRGAKVIECRVYDVLQDGELRATPAGVSLEPDKIEMVIALLQEAKRKATERG